ncbi:MAG: hypothetical protein DELT_01712 [Desulfovibrio sp.]
MTDQDKARFASIMGGMAEVYGREISKQALSLHFRVLQPFGIDEVEEAAVRILSSRTYSTMPTPADFLQFMTGGSVEDRAEIETAKVVETVARIGGNASVVFDNPTTAAVIRNAYGGWVKLCEDCGVAESEKWFRHNFAKTWAAYERQGVRVYGVLAGREEIANRAAGFLAEVPPPRLVGDKDAAQRVLAAQALEEVTE